jgi:hypothetical protein
MHAWEANLETSEKCIPYHNIHTIPYQCRDDRKSTIRGFSGFDFRAVVKGDEGDPFFTPLPLCHYSKAGWDVTGVNAVDTSTIRGKKRCPLLASSGQVEG